MNGLQWLNQNKDFKKSVNIPPSSFMSHSSLIYFLTAILLCKLTFKQLKWMVHNCIVKTLRISSLSYKQHFRSKKGHTKPGLTVDLKYVDQTLMCSNSLQSFLTKYQSLLFKMNICSKSKSYFYQLKNTCFKRSVCVTIGLP